MLKSCRFWCFYSLKLKIFRKCSIKVNTFQHLKGGDYVIKTGKINRDSLFISKEDGLSFILLGWISKGFEKLINFLINKLEISALSQSGLRSSILVNIAVHLMWLEANRFCRLTEFSPFIYELDWNNIINAFRWVFKLCLHLGKFLFIFCDSIIQL